MKSIRFTFTRAAAPDCGFSTFWLLVFAIAILDDAQDREERQRKRNERFRKPQPPAGPKPG